MARGALTVEPFRQAFRQLRRRAGVTMVSVGVLALGIALCVTTFGVLDRAVLRGLPFPDGDRMVAFSTGEEPGWPMPIDDYRAVAEGQRTLLWTSPLRTFNTMITRGDHTRGVIGSYVPPRLLERLGIAPVAGRGFTVQDEEPGNPAVALISHRLWQGVYGGDPAILGEVVTLNREPTIVVGVLPPGFGFPLRTDVWGVFGRPGRGQGWDSGPVLGLGVLADGASVASARRDLARLAALLDEERPRAGGRSASVDFFTRAIVADRTEGALRAMVVAALVLLLLTAANLANLRLSETLRRRRELRTRVALGSSPIGLAGLLLLENLALGAAAVALGVGLAFGLLEGVGTVLLRGGDLERAFWARAALDWRVAGFAAACALGAAGLSALLPMVVAMHGVRAPRAVPADDSRTHATPWSRPLVGAQAGICFALLVAAGLWTSRARELVRVEPGFDAEGLSSVLLSTYQTEVREAGERRDLLDRLRRSLSETPGVLAAAYADAVPWGFAPYTVPIAAGSGPVEAETAPRATIYEVSPGFFETLGLPLQAGRDFRALEASHERVAVVSRSLSEALFGGSALGRTVTLEGREGDEPPQAFHVVGVATDLAPTGRGDRDGVFAVYLPMSARSASAFMILRRRPDVPYARPLVEGALARSAPLIGILEELRAADALASAAWAERRLGQIFSLFAFMAWLVTTTGVYAVIAVMVQGRARELGIRAAIGARPRDLQRLVLGESGRQLVIGGAVGLAMLALGAGFLDPLSVGEVPFRWPVVVASAVAVALASLLASWAPTRRAGRTDPTRCLRAP